MWFGIVDVGGLWWGKCLVEGDNENGSYRKVLFMGVWDILFIGEELFFLPEKNVYNSR